MEMGADSREADMLLGKPQDVPSSYVHVIKLYVMSPHVVSCLVLSVDCAL